MPRPAVELAAARARVRHGLWPVAQASVAAGLAWYIAHDLLGHPQPFFAPIAAAVSLSSSNVLRSQRAVQLITGVALGIGVGVAVAALVEGPLAIAVAVLVAMCLALTVGVGFLSGQMFVNQSAASAILVIALRTSATGAERLLDALIGGGVVLVISVLMFPADPLRLLDEASRHVGATLRDALSQLEDQIAGRTPVDSSWPMHTGQTVHLALAQLATVRSTARIIVRVAPRHWHRRAEIELVIDCSTQLDLLGNSILGLLKAVHAALADRVTPRTEVSATVHTMRASAQAIAEYGLDLGPHLPPILDVADRGPLRDAAPTPAAARYRSLLAALAEMCLLELRRLRSQPCPPRHPGTAGQLRRHGLGA